MVLKEPLILKIFGKVEVNTIIRKMEGKKLKQTEKNYLYRSIRPKLIAAEMLSQAGVLKEINRDKHEDTSLIDYNLAVYGYKLILPVKPKALLPIMFKGSWTRTNFSRVWPPAPSNRLRTQKPSWGAPFSSGVLDPVWTCSLKLIVISLILFPTLYTSLTCALLP